LISSEYLEEYLCDLVRIEYPHADSYRYVYSKFCPDIFTVPDNKSRNIPEVFFVRRWAVGVLGIWREGVGWERGGSRWVSLSATWD
jgi:hypothetical protein